MADATKELGPATTDTSLKGWENCSAKILCELFVTGEQGSMQSMADITMALVMRLLKAENMTLDRFNGQADEELSTDTQLYPMAVMIEGQFSGDTVAYFEMVELGRAIFRGSRIKSWAQGSMRWLESWPNVSTIEKIKRTSLR